MADSVATRATLNAAALAADSDTVALWVKIFGSPTELVGSVFGTRVYFRARGRKWELYEPHDRDLTHEELQALLAELVAAGKSEQEAYEGAMGKRLIANGWLTADDETFEERTRLDVIQYAIDRFAEAEADAEDARQDVDQDADQAGDA